MGSQRQGELAPGMLLVGTVANASTSARWFGMPVTETDVAVGHRSIDVSASGAGTLFSLLLDRNVVADPFPLENADPRGNDGAYFVRSSLAAARLRGFLHAVFALRDSSPAALRDPATNEQVETALVALLKRPVEGQRVARGASFGLRFKAVRTCQEYMREHIDEAISLKVLSDLSGFRPRSLINAFEAFTGLSPIAYLKARRLNYVRKALLSTPPDRARIIDIAMDWGFEHMGHFAADYRAMFGERPSDTTRAAPAVSRGTHLRSVRAEDRGAAKQTGAELLGMLLRFSELGDSRRGGTIGA